MMRTFALVCCVGILCACDGDNGTSSDGATDASTGTATEATSGSDTEAGTDETTQTESDSETEATTEATTDETTESTEDPTKASETEDPTTETTETGGDACVELAEKDCKMANGCMAILGGEVISKPGISCVTEATFLGCIPAIGCDDAISYFCDPKSDAIYQTPSGCGPAMWEMCEPEMLPDMQC